ncbi:MAG TPA: hypothetical protein VKF61_03140 [Candidatus Polarisedimenticolia bacterium]|nr:hypothetical protein [Candidatus Polarisedimenticolia bacterium]
MTRTPIVLALVLIIAAAALPLPAQEARQYAEGRSLVHEFTGVVAEPAPRIRVETDLGTVSVRAADTREVRYRIRVRVRGADDAATRRLLDDMQISAAMTGGVLLFRGQAAVPGAARDLSADFEIDAPARTEELEVATGAGDISVQGLGGRANLATRGGNITADRIGGPLRAETRGGNIAVGTVQSTARLVTAGGSVSLDSAGGEVVAQSSGGDVLIKRTSDQVRAETGGGNVVVDSAGGDVSAHTSGGSIQVGGARGEVTAATAGGSIRIASAQGGVRCESGAGPIFLKAIEGPIRAVTSAGSIQAELAPASRLLFDSDLQTWQGDVTLALPESQPVTIRAIVDQSQGNRIRSDFPLHIYREAEDAGRPVEIGEGPISGGGSLIKIRTLDGHIAILKAPKAHP